MIVDVHQIDPVSLITAIAVPGSGLFYSSAFLAITMVVAAEQIPFLPDPDVTGCLSSFFFPASAVMTTAVAAVNPHD